MCLVPDDWDTNCHAVSPLATLGSANRRHGGPGKEKRRWRDANLMDLARPELRPLIDLRSKPNYHAPSYHDEELDLVHACLPPQGSSPLAGDGRSGTH